MPRSGDAKRKQYYSRSFEGGMDASVQPTRIGYDQVQLAINTRCGSRGILEKRAGLTPLITAGDLPAATYVRNAVMWNDEVVPGDNINRVAFAIGTELLSADTDGTLYDHGETLATGTSFISMVEWGSRVFYSDQTNHIKEITDTGTPSFTVINATYNAQYMAPYTASERLFIIDAADMGDKIRWCDGADPTTFGVESVWQPGGFFTAIGEMGDMFLIAQYDKLYRIIGTNPSTWSIRLIPSDGIGVTAAYTLQIIDGVAIFLSKYGLAYYDGNGRPRIVSDPVADYIPSDPANWMEAFAIIDDTRYMLFYSSDGGMDQGTVPGCDRVIVWDFREDSWEGPYEIPRCQHGCVQVGNHEEQIFIGGKDGNIRTYNTTFLDNAAAYDMEVTFRAFEGSDPTQDYQARELRLFYESGGAQDIVLSLFREDEATAVKSKTFTVASGTGMLKMAIPMSRGRLFTPKMTNTADESLKIRAVELDLYTIDHG
ncbi:MAG: hypothetical protein PF636_11540 [Actinomycetota bacterium]|jgi:hypothetical protein|nr:hypothetical protein [Actinomycetota bacterium]